MSQTANQTMNIYRPSPNFTGIWHTASGMLWGTEPRIFSKPWRRDSGMRSRIGLLFALQLWLESGMRIPSRRVTPRVPATFQREGWPTTRLDQFREWCELDKVVLRQDSGVLGHERYPFRIH